MVSTNGKFENPVAVQSTRLDVSAGHQYNLELEDIGANTSEE